MERPTVVAMAPTELSEKQRFVLKTMVEQHAPPRFAAIFALGYWAGLRISEIATLRLDQCIINQRAGSVTLVDAKGGKTRTLDLHNMARRALYDYLYPTVPQELEREPPGPAKPSSFLKVIERLRYIRSFGLDPLLARRVHANRLRRLAHEGEQYTPQFLERFDPLRRYATLVAYLLDMTATLTDTALEMHDHIMGLLFKQGQKSISPSLSNAAKPSTKRCACMRMWAMR
jgi:hypothetical protein